MLILVVDREIPENINPVTGKEWLENVPSHDMTEEEKEVSGSCSSAGRVGLNNSLGSSDSGVFYAGFNNALVCGLNHDLPSVLPRS